MGQDGRTAKTIPAHHYVAKGEGGLIPVADWIIVCGKKNHTMDIVPDFTTLADCATCWFYVDPKGLYALLNLFFTSCTSCAKWGDCWIEYSEFNARS
jgi:hypothetical protein